MKEKDEVLSPIEHTIYTGYYYVPNIEHIIITKEGNVINSLTGNKLSAYVDGKGYFRTSIKVGNKPKHFRIHRLLALTFVGRPERHLDKSFDELMVNHKDGDKQNNEIDNLEWCIAKENIIHSIDTRLRNYTNVLSKNVLTGEIVKYLNLSRCSDQFKISLNNLKNYLLNNKKCGKLTRNWCVFKFDDDSNWPELQKSDLKENSWSYNTGIWYGRDINTNKLYLFRNISGISRAMLVNYDTIKSHIHRTPNQPFQNLIFKYEEIPEKVDC